MPLVMVDDLDDARLSDYRHLREPNVRARVERNAGIFTVEGWLSLEALAESPYPVRSALVATQHAARAQSILDADVPIYAIPESALEQVTGIHFHRGIVGVAERPAAMTPDAVLDGARTPKVRVAGTCDMHRHIHRRAKAGELAFFVCPRRVIVKQHFKEACGTDVGGDFGFTVHLIRADDSVEDWPTMDKDAVASRLAQSIAAHLKGNTP